MSNILVKLTRSSLTLSNCPPEVALQLQYTREDISHEQGSFKSTPVSVAYASYDSKTLICRTYPNAFHIVKSVSERLGHTLEITDQRSRPDLDISKINKAEYRTACYQALEAVCKAKSSGLIIGPTGVGKTSILCGLVKMLPAHFKVLVTTEDKNVTSALYQALSEALPNEKIGMYIDKKSLPGRVITTNLDSLKEFTQGQMAYNGFALKDFDVWICDEVHRLPVQSRIPFLSQFRPVFSWGLTATPKRADNSHILNEVIFGAPIYSIGFQEVLDIQEKTGESGIVPVKVMVFPLTSEKPIPDDKSLYWKIRTAYLANESFKSLVKAIDQMLPQDAKSMIFVDTIRLGYILKKLMPYREFVHGKHSLDYRKNILAKLKDNTIRGVICTDIWSEGIDVPDLSYVIDCSAKVSPNRIIQRAGRAARSSTGKEAGVYVMFLCLSSEHLFNQGLSKLKAINALGWDVKFMFGREVVKTLTFDRAPVLTELGGFAD